MPHNFIPTLKDIIDCFFLPIYRAGPVTFDRNHNNKGNDIDSKFKYFNYTFINKRFYRDVGLYFIVNAYCDGGVFQSLKYSQLLICLSNYIISLKMGQ